MQRFRTLECLAWARKSGYELEAEVGTLSNKGKDKVPTKTQEECKENYSHFGVLKLF